MAGPDGIVLGFDPGGKNAFGWSVCVTRDGRLEKPIQTGIADDAVSTLRAVEGYLEIEDAVQDLRVLAAGIDAPLFWSEDGDRKVDVCLRTALENACYPKAKSGGTVQAVNSLRGACVVQGPLLAKHLTQLAQTHANFKNLQMTESHPRAVLHILDHYGQRDMIVRLTGDLHCYTKYNKRCLCGCEELSKLPVAATLSAEKRAEQKREARRAHMRDATLAAISASAMIHKPTGWRNLYPGDAHAVKPFSYNVAYWMPASPAPSRG